MTKIQKQMRKMSQLETQEPRTDGPRRDTRTPTILRKERPTGPNKSKQLK